jgi:tetratricopeptide (TPR) repeat protein
VLLVLLAGTAAGLCSRSRGGRTAGFLGAWFFAILAPTSLIPVATQTIAEHRMYLPLAAVVTGLVLGLEKILVRPVLLAAAAGVIAVGLATATAIRNEAYLSEITLWSDTVAKRPGNDRARNNLGNALFLAGRIREAITQYEEALQLHPHGDADAEYNLGQSYLQEGRLPEAIAHGIAAVRLAPANPEAHNNLGMALERSERRAEAAVQFQEAIVQYQVMLRDDPEDARMKNGLAIAHYNAGNLLAAGGRMPEAAAEYQQALHFKPTLPEAQLNWGNALLTEGRAAEAIGHYRAALQLRPDYPQARRILEEALRQGQPSEQNP